jgi:hypothetical protein
MLHLLLVPSGTANVIIRLYASVPTSLTFFPIPASVVVFSALVDSSTGTCYSIKTSSALISAGSMLHLLLVPSGTANVITKLYTSVPTSFTFFQFLLLSVLEVCYICC